MASENPRTESARDHDDKPVIEGMIPGGAAVPSSGGGALAREVGSAADLGQVDDPDGKVRATKQDDIDAGVASRSDRE
ncbi:hypothetical protein KZ813_03725 [Sphingomonas sp. RHCKR7]|uniref:hypothetical protein n=1 Tax=Sphingomonas folli TaxID=2862497 RepID=UPI001CA5CCF5|nr:hypothetical protein [Sphingomonas folli]MBW6525939.1 hypothetical protein [Sphingomonas folli]